ncbi:unnamed protein product [Moneuplotes crassus]|uniref:Uncharacterized protein n=1 Tax=Euplotes crassus TaxID=5936 RepID=A0AAD2D6E7_EUPCR|nr:unnamed protein product [Moneuplotes crassus]
MQNKYKLKVINEKERNIIIELKHRNSLLLMENDIIGDRLNILTKAIHTLGDFQQHELEFKVKIEALSREINSLKADKQSGLVEISDLLQKIELRDGYLEEMNKARKKAHEEKNAFLKEAKLRIKQQSKEVNELSKENEEYKAKLVQLDKDIKLNIKEKDQLRERIVDIKKRKSFSTKIRICRNCEQEYLEDENFKWSCVRHTKIYSGEMWWCCGRKNKEDPGCTVNFHINKDFSKAETDKEITENRKLRLKNHKCECCKKIGHEPNMCSDDPNYRTPLPIKEEYKRVEKIFEKASNKNKGVFPKSLKKLFFLVQEAQIKKNLGKDSDDPQDEEQDGQEENKSEASELVIPKGNHIDDNASSEVDEESEELFHIEKSDSEDNFDTLRKTLSEGINANARNKINLEDHFSDVEYSEDNRKGSISNHDNTENPMMRQTSIISYQKDFPTEKDRKIIKKKKVNFEHQETFRDNITDNDFDHSHDTSILRLIKGIDHSQYQDNDLDYDDMALDSEDSGFRHKEEQKELKSIENITVKKSTRKKHIKSINESERTTVSGKLPEYPLKMSINNSADREGSENTRKSPSPNNFYPKYVFTNHSENLQTELSMNRKRLLQKSKMLKNKTNEQNTEG